MALSKHIQDLIASDPVHKALDPVFVDSLIRTTSQKYFPEIKTIATITRIQHKQRVGIHNSTFINSYIIQGLTSDGKKITKEIVYSAHTDGSRKIAFKNLRLFREHGFSSGKFQVVRPLEYRDDIHTLLYEGASGKTLIHYLEEKTPPQKLKHVLTLIAEWVYAFHYTEISAESLSSIPLFNPQNLYHPASEVVNVVIEKNSPQGEKAKAFFDAYNKFEKSLHGSYAPRVTYGDLHPENVIISDLSQKELIMVDLTDVAVGDELRDIGTFLQQLSFMARNYYSPEELSSLSTVFIEAYFKIASSKLSITSFQRINLYQAWTAMRSFEYFFYDEEKQEQSYGLLEDAWLYLSRAQKGEAILTIDHKPYVAS